MRTANYIVGILKAYLNTILSWGLYNLTAHTDGLSFKVQGFKFKGTVSIVYNEGTDLFDISFKNENGIEKIEDVYVDTLVDVIDRHVEFTGTHYRQDVEEWLSNMNYEVS